MTRLPVFGAFAVILACVNGAHAQAVSGYQTHHGSNGYGYSQTIGPVTYYHGYGPGGSYSGTAMRSGPMTIYNGHGPAGSYHGTAITSGPMTTYDGRVGTQHYHATGQTVGNSTFIRGRTDAGAGGYGQSFSGVGHRFGNISTYQGFGANGRTTSYGYGYSYGGW